MTTHTTTARRALRLAATTTVALVIGGLGVQGASAADAFDPPVAVADVYYMVQGTTLDATPGLLDNDSSPYGGALTVSSLDVMTEVATFDFYGNLGHFKYTPDPFFVGHTSYYYWVQDAATGLITQSHFTIYVAAAEVAPTTTPDFYSIPKNTVLNVGVGGLLLNDSLQFPTGFTGNSRWDVLPGHQIHVHAIDGSFTYTPPVDFVGSFTFEYKLQSQEGLQSDWTLVTIEVTEPAAVIPADDPIPAAEVVPVDVPTLAHTGPVATALIAPALALLSLGLVGIYFAGRRTHSFI